MDERTRSTQQAYDQVAADFAVRTADRSPMAAEFFDEFAAMASPGSIVVDLGCGPGHDVQRLRAAGHLPVGLDRSTGLLTQFSGAAPLVSGDLRSVPLAARSVDAIWSAAALLHLERADLGPTLLEWDRILRPGGLVGIATSLGEDTGDEGWEMVPAGPARVPEVAPADRRWFVHHEQFAVVQAATDAGWSVLSTTVRQSHRQWLQLLATKAVS